MKVLVAVFGMMAIASAQRNYGPVNPIDDIPRPYSFNYVAEGEEGTSGHQESRDANGNVRGYYTLTDIDGRNRMVEYLAGPEGFKAFIRTNEPGTDNQNPADVVIESSADNAPGVQTYRSTDSAKENIRGQEPPQGYKYVRVPY